MSIGFELWFVDGCFIADEYFFVGECFYEGESKGWSSGWVDWFDWVRGWLGIGRRCSYARVYARSRTRSFVFFAVTSVTVDGVENLFHPKNDRSFREKWQVVLWKVTGCFVKSDGSFYEKWRVVLGWRLKMLFWGWCLGEFLGWSSSVKVWHWGMLFLKPI